MTDVDYQGETYYTIRNLSLYECQVIYLAISTHVCENVKMRISISY